jgi:mannitol-1-phosphate/altronate dehydrogenase
MTLPLNRETLRLLSARIAVPRYDPEGVTAGIVHLGLGGFHRAHMARYTHDLMQRDASAMRWGIAGTGLMPGDQAMREALLPQDGLYTLVERDGVSERANVIGSLAAVVSPEEVLARIDDPAIRIVSLTVTGHGYCLDAATRRLDFGHPLIAHDLANRGAPRSAIGILAAAYARRRVPGGRAFTALSCDNIPHNGAVLRSAVLDFARRVDPELAAWIEAEGRFPGTMVDRITPVTRPEDVAHVAETYGVADAWPVVCEAFSQWVIEDDFADGRPDWNRAGAQFVADVAPYETMKLRLLNASHLAVSGLGALLGLVTIDETMRHPRVAGYMAALMEDETGPTVPPVPGIDLPAYRTALIARFANPAIRDTVDRVNTDAPVNYLLDPIRDRLAADQPIPLLALALAAWLRRVRGDLGEVRHPLADLLRETAIAGGTDPRPLLSIAPLFGELGQDSRLIAAVGRHLASFYTNGAEATLTDALS